MLLAQLPSLLLPMGRKKGEQAGIWSGSLIVTLEAEGKKNRRQRDVGKIKRHSRGLYISLMHCNEMTQCKVLCS